MAHSIHVRKVVRTIGLPRELRRIIEDYAKLDEYEHLDLLFQGKTLIEFSMSKDDYLMIPATLFVRNNYDKIEITSDLTNGVVTNMDVLLFATSLNNCDLDPGISYELRNSYEKSEALGILIEKRTSRWHSI